MAGRLRELRARNGYSQQGMAELAEVSQSTWSKWEVETPEQFASLGKLAQRLDTSADYLLGITDDPTPAAKREDWTPEAIETVNLINQLPATTREHVLTALKAIVELANERVILLSQSLTDAKDESLAMLKLFLRPDDFEHVRDLVDRGQPLTESQINRILQAGGYQPFQQNLHLHDYNGSRSNRQGIEG